MEAVIREAPFGQLVRLVTKNKYFQYPEEKADFQLPETWIDVMNQPDTLRKGSSQTEKPEPESPGSEGRQPGDSNDSESHDAESLHGESDGDVLSRVSTERTLPFTEDRLEANEHHEIEKVKSTPIVPKRTKDGVVLVDWYYTDDPENPHNWSNTKRALIATIICLYTFVVYTTSAIYTSSTQGVMEEFGVSTLVATLGLSLYVLGYGTGPLLFSPLSEIPVIGRNPVYIITMFLFVIISIPTAFVGNFGGLLVLRFLQGFFGSPCLASGGASIGDMYSLMSLPYALMAWVSAAYCGPALGPLLSGFAVPVKGWRWSLFESIWASAPVFIIMFMFLPETSSATILYRRASRLRKLNNNPKFMSQSEIDQHNLSLSAVTVDALIKPIEITIKDPAVLFVQIYTAIIYGIYYSFFEVFPLVYPVDYHMNLGQIGLVFLCVLVSCILGIAVYFSYIYFWMNPRIAKHGFPVPEARLIPALAASVGPTVGLFLFAWTARASIHWIVPTIGITIYGGTVFIVMQCLFVYIPLSYPQYAASLFAANDFFRSALACGSVIFAHPLFGNLGVARGTSLLGGLSVIGILGIWLLYFYGARLRALSKFAISETNVEETTVGDQAE
ncbi:major facilitator superfamily domain-containing protein [Penicillium cinerascens]|uniref:Major facilitator superfamily domain-containing protein n=1 Tax=Penicillium cinerascens TaxID=70096 RepID=A0A9W9TBK3_9EURO|nr:major facilitator superfamily domain-containing protein [Penicillium cinerascens]KAJ5216531.1 major facilitator superfamily domain-containing protein [Penicillium cinerascens]